MATNKMRYLRQVDKTSLAQILDEWQGRFPKMGVCAYVPEAQKENVAVLQAACTQTSL